MKKSLFILVVFFSILFMSGCGNSEASLNTKINKDGSIDMKSKISTDSILPNLSIQDSQINNTIFNIEGKNGTAKMYKDGDKTISELNYHFKDYKELDSVFSKVAQDNIKVQVIKHKGIIFNKYDFSVDVQNSLTPDNLNKRIEAEAAKNNIPLNLTKIKDLNNLFASSVTLSNSLTIPGKVTKSNGTIDGDTVTWKYQLSELKDNTKMTATFRVINPKGLITVVVISLILILCLAIFLYKRKHKVRT